MPIWRSSANFIAMAQVSKTIQVDHPHSVPGWQTSEMSIWRSSANLTHTSLVSSSPFHIMPYSSEYGIHETVKSSEYGIHETLESSEYGVHKSNRANVAYIRQFWPWIWPWLPGQSFLNYSSCSLFTRRGSRPQKFPSGDPPQTWRTPPWWAAALPSCLHSRDFQALRSRGRAPEFRGVRGVAHPQRCRLRKVWVSQPEPVQNFEGYVTQFAQHKAWKLNAWWKLTFDERVVVHRVHFSIQEQVLIKNVERFWGGLVLKVHRLLYHSTLGSRVITKKERVHRMAGPRRSLPSSVLNKLPAREFTSYINICIYMYKHTYIHIYIYRYIYR